VTFLWGTAVSGHQVEGDNIHSDWWAAEAAGLLPEKSGKACNFWNRWKEDFDLIERWGHNCLRFGIEWARTEPEPGRFDDEALDRYVEMVADLQRRGIEPMVTLHHFVNPRWLAEAGGWEKAENVERFVRWADRVVPALAPHVRYWITINEPMVYAYESYSIGYWPPFKKSLTAAMRVLGNLLEAHARAYGIIHEHRPDALVSLAKHVRICQPHRAGHPGDRLAARLQDELSNESVLRAMRTGRFLGRRIRGLAGSWDFIGLNYYTRQRVRFALDPGNGFGREVPPEGEVNDLDWEIYPEGLYLALKRLGVFGLPVIVTENGICARGGDDAQRVGYIELHLDAVERARREGVDARGYLYWTLMDNFEWAEGYKARFGLVEVDFETLERRPRPSAAAFARLGERFEDR